MAEARELLIKAEQAEQRKLKIKIVLFVAFIALIIAGAFWYKKFSAEQEEQRIQQEAEQEAKEQELEQERQAEAQRAEAQKKLEQERQTVIMKLEKAAEAQRRAEAQRQTYGSDYAKGEEYLNAKDYSPAFEIFKRLANDGYAPAQDKLAWMYQNGWGVEQSYSQAVNWFRKAAEQGNMQALASMGLMYYKGWGVAQNYDTALEWYKKAAAQGYEVAQRRVDMISMLKEVKPRIQNLERNKELPVPGTIADNNVNVRSTPSTSARSQKKLNSGHPISISGTNEADHEFWYYVKTASGTEGWVLASYVNVNLEPSRTSQEKSNRNYTLPARGYIANLKTPDSKLNVRNLPSMKGSSVKNTAVQGYEVVVSEIFADNEVDWYHVETTPEAISEIVETEGYVPEYTVIDGWISGKYLNITGNKVSSNSQQAQQNSSHQQQAQNTSGGNRATVFSAKDFHDEVAQNPIRAANKYQNEPLIIIGTVEQIGDFFGVPNITVYALGEFGLPVGVIEFFMQKNDPMLTRISKGNTVAIIGCIDNAASYITSMKDCKVWAVNVNGDWVYGDRVYP